MRNKIRFLLIPLLSLCVSINATAESLGHIGDLIRETCKYYDGAPLQQMLPAVSADDMDNPLSQSPLGRKLFLKNAKRAYNEYEYLTPDPTIRLILASPEYGPALDQCYGQNQMAKENFTLFLRKGEIDGKMLAFYSEAMAFTMIGGAFAKATAWLAFRVRALSTVMVWSQKALIPVSALFSGYAVYQLVQYKKGKHQQATLKMDDKLDADAKTEMDITRATALDSIRDLEQQRNILHKQVLQSTNSVEQKTLYALEIETNQLIIKLKKQLQ